MSENLKFTPDRAREFARELTLETKKLLWVQGITSGANPAIKPLDLWKRLQTALEQAASGSRNTQEFLTAYLRKLNHVHPSKAWSSSIYSRLRGDTFSAESGDTVTVHAIRLIGEPIAGWDTEDRQNWQILKNTIRSESAFIIVEAQALEQERREASE